MSKKQTRPGGQSPRRKRFLFHLAALGVVLTPLVLVELVLRLCVPAPQISLDDPYVSFSGLRSLFVLNASGTHYETGKERLTYFCPQSFSTTKDPNTLRIFCLGGSTVQGRPFSAETSFTTWLQLNLQAGRPKGQFEVINCGGISYASYRLVPIMRELLDHAPDLFILYTGHNEFLEDRTYGRIKQIPRPLFRVHQTLLKLRSYALAHQYLYPRLARSDAVEPAQRTTLPSEVKTKLDTREGPKSYHRDPLWRSGTMAHFRRNLDLMLRMAQNADVPIILMNPVSNLKDSPPFKSEYRSNLSPQDRERIIALRDQASDLGWIDAQDKLSLLQEAAQIDTQHAELCYLIGKCYEQLGRLTEAKTWFVRAREEDICPLRMLQAMHQAVLEVAKQHRVPLVDIKQLFEQRSRESLVGDEWLLDHVHPSITGHQLIADALYPILETMGLAHRPQNWDARKKVLWQQQLASLGDAYYMHGQDHLKRLLEWSRGRIPDP
jgi:hypothetical protein